MARQKERGSREQCVQRGDGVRDVGERYVVIEADTGDELEMGRQQQRTMIK